MKRKKIYIKTPSTYMVGVEDSMVLDFNKYCWDYFLSESFIKETFQKFDSMPIEKPEGITVFKDYILKNINIVNQIKNLTSEKIEEPYIWFYFQFFYSALSIFQIVHDKFIFSLAYGVYPKGSIYNYAENSDIESNIFYKPLQQALENFSFGDNIEYEFVFHFEHELYFIIILSKYIRKYFSNVKIIVNFDNSNEQVDFSSWLTNEEILKYVDSFVGIGENEKYPDNISLRRIGDFYWTTTRLFHTRCFWRKCTFCTINAGGRLEKGMSELNRDVKGKVGEFLDKIEQYRNITIFLIDEAIEGSILLYLAHQIIARDIKCNISCRTRLSKTFTRENCEILSKAGIITIGMGLESVNHRITKLMNKREEYLSGEDIRIIIKNMDSSDIRVHLYFIIGFPSEVKNETDETLDFVNSLLKECSFFTYTPNVFYLMKGSIVFENPTDFGITITESNDAKLGGISFADNNPGIKYSREEFFYKSQSNISNIFFIPPLTRRQILIANAYWEYTDRSGIFYRLKILNKNNCFWKREKNILMTKEDLNNYFILIPMIEIEEGKFYNIILNKVLLVDNMLYSTFKTFHERYTNDKTLIVNIENAVMDELEENRISCISRMIDYSNVLLNDFVLINKNN